MGKCNGKSSHSQLQSMRARLRRASCMHDDAFDDDNDDDNNYDNDTAAPGESPPRPQPAVSDAGHGPARVRDDGRESYEQLQSAFFARLPAEVRRMIYAALWRSSNPLMKMHLHAGCDGPRLTTTPCQYVPKAEYSTRDDEIDPMYAEAIESFFESTTLIFTASEDAYRFMVSQPHSHLSKIHALDFEFTHFNDHLFLQRIEQSAHPRLLPADGDGGAAAAVPVAWELWAPLMGAVRARLPDLRELRVALSSVPGRRDAEGFYRFLLGWEGSGYGGAVEERAEGVVYVEYAGWRPGVDKVPGHRGYERSNSLEGADGSSLGDAPIDLEES